MMLHMVCACIHACLCVLGWVGGGPSISLLVSGCSVHTGHLTCDTSFNRITLHMPVFMLAATCIPKNISVTMTLDLLPSFTDARYKYEKMVKSTMKSWRTAEAAGSDEASYPAESEKTNHQASLSARPSFMFSTSSRRRKQKFFLKISIIICNIFCEFLVWRYGHG